MSEDGWIKEMRSNGHRVSGWGIGASVTVDDVQVEIRAGNDGSFTVDGSAMQLRSLATAILAACDFIEARP